MAKFDLLIAAKTTGSAGVKRLGNSMQGLQGKVKNVSASMGLLNKTMAAFAVIAAAMALGRMVKQSIDLADSFGKMSDQTGVAANTLMAWTNAGKLAGTTQEEIDKGLRRLARTMIEADRGLATYKRTFDDLGISVRDTEGNMKTTQQVFEEVAERFSKMENGAKKAALAQELFGRSGVNLVNLLNGGKVALSEFTWELSENFAQNAEYFNDQMAVMGIRAKGLGMTFTDSMLPALNSSAESFGELLDTESNWSAWFEILNAGFKTLSTVVFATVASLKFMGRALVDLFKINMLIYSGKWKEAWELMRKGFSDTTEQAKKDGQALVNIWTGVGEAPDSYTNSLKGAAAQFGETFGGSMKAKLAAFGKQMGDVGGLVAKTVTKAFKGLEDQLVSFVTTGKIAFGDLARSIIADMARIAIRATITLPLMKAFGFTLSAKGNVFNQQGLVPYAKGGVVNKPTMFQYGGSNLGIMGEAGPEAILPLSRGKDGKLGVQGGGGVSVVVNVDASSTKAEGDTQQADAIGRMLGAAIQAELIQQQRPGGLLATA